VKLNHWRAQPRRAARRAVTIATVALVVSALAVAAGAAFAGPDRKSALPAKIVVGVVDSITGPAGFCGVEEQQGIALAVKEAKRQHFLGKSEIELKLIDDRSNVDAAVSGMSQQIDAKVAAVVGLCNGANAIVSIPVAGRAGMPLVITTASAADPSPAHVFRAGIPQSRYASQVIRLLKGRGVKKVAVFYDTSVPTIANPVWNNAQRIALKNLGIELAEVEAAPVATAGVADFSSQVAKLLRAKPDAIGVLLQGAPNLTVVNQLRQAGFKGPIWGQQGMLAPFFINGGPNVNGVLVSVSFAPGLGPTSSKVFAKKFEQRWGRPPTELGAHGYDAMWMLMRALKAANSTDHAKIIAALTAIKKMPGAQGDLRFNAIGDAVGRGFVAEFRDGKMVGISK
jgi:branched-chain amino acid transport system substrate-binding protein